MIIFPLTNQIISNHHLFTIAKLALVECSREDPLSSALV